MKDEGGNGELRAASFRKAGSSGDTQVADLYDRLLTFEKDGDGAPTVHKRLRFPDAWVADGIVDVNDWLVRELAISAETHILDAGCGCGATLFALLKEQGSGLGLTLSGDQVAVARNSAETLKVNDRIHFAQQSYDAPLDDKFDIIITIEALLHSGDLAGSIANLARSLKPGGQLVLVEEMAVDDGASGLKKMLGEMWHLSEVFSAENYHKSITATGLTITETHDFTLYVQARRWPIPLLKIAKSLLSLLSKNRRDLLKIYLGGLALESLYARKKIHYQIWIATRTGAGVEPESARP